MSFTLGQWVTVIAVVVPQKRWQAPYIRRTLTTYPAHHKGIVAGTRTMVEGYTVNNGEEGLEFRPTKHHQVVLVAVSKRQMVRAFPADVTTEKAVQE